MEFISALERPELKGRLKDLYRQAFPRQERAPWFLLKSRLKNGMAELVGFYDGEQFAGMLYLVYFRDIVFVFYLAVIAELRGMGYGSAVLDEIKRRHPGKRVILNIESVDYGGGDYHEKVKRKQFYFKNGFRDSGFRTRERNVVYDMLWFGGEVSCDEYLELTRKYMGKLIFRLFYKKHM